MCCDGCEDEVCCGVRGGDVCCGVCRGDFSRGNSVIVLIFGVGSGSGVLSCGRNGSWRMSCCSDVFFFFCGAVSEVFFLLADVLDFGASTETLLLLRTAKGFLTKATS